MRVNVNRRGFLRALFAAPFIAPLARLLPEKIQRRCGLLTPKLLAELTLQEFKRGLEFARVMNESNSIFAGSGRKIGDTINIRKPARFQP